MCQRPNIINPCHGDLARVLLNLSSDRENRKKQPKQPKLKYMNKLKYLAVIMVGIAGLGLQQAKADFVSTLNVGNSSLTGFAGPYGTVTVSLNVVTQVATFTFTSNSPAYSFIDSHIAAINVSTTFNNLTIINDPFFVGSGSGQVDGLGNFSLFLNNSDGFGSKIDTLSFSIHNTGTAWTDASQVLTFNNFGFDAAAHIAVNSTGGLVTGFAGEGPTVPDGGTTVMLLGMALSGLGMARRYLKS